MTIEEDGFLGNCPKRQDKYLTLSEFDKFFLNKKRLEWIKFQKIKPNICQNCEFKNICHGGCPLKMKQFLSNSNSIDKNNCPGFYPFLKYIKSNLESK